MTLRDRKIVKAILDVLHNLDGRQVEERLLHAEVNLHVTPTASLAEFNADLILCDSRGWLIGVEGKFGGRKWNISDAGEAARLEMQ